MILSLLAPGVGMGGSSVVSSAPAAVYAAGSHVRGVRQPGVPTPGLPGLTNIMGLRVVERPSGR